MRLVSYESRNGPRAGVVEGDDVADGGDSVFDAAVRADSGRTPLSEVRLLAPVRPGKVVAVGLNYRDHAVETGQSLPSIPLLFAKFPSSVVGPGAPIVLPPSTVEADYEAELGVVIGRTASGVSEAEALGCVLGYTCLNDVSARDVQFADGQWVRGKSFDSFCPIGPWIVTADEIADPQRLRIRCLLNNEVMQDSSTAEMIFRVAELISASARDRWRASTAPSPRLTRRWSTLPSGSRSAHRIARTPRSPSNAFPMSHPAGLTRPGHSNCTLTMTSRATALPSAMRQ